MRFLLLVSGLVLIMTTALVRWMPNNGDQERYLLAEARQGSYLRFGGSQERYPFRYATSLVKSEGQYVGSVEAAPIGDGEWLEEVIISSQDSQPISHILLRASDGFQIEIPHHYLPAWDYYALDKGVMYYQVPERINYTSDLYRLTPTSKLPKQITNLPGFIAEFEIYDDRILVIVLESGPQSRQARLYRVNPDTQAVEVLSEPYENLNFYGISPSGEWVLYLADNHYLYALSLTHRNPEPIYIGNTDYILFSDLYLSPDEQWVAYISMDRDRSGIQLFNLHTHQSMQVHEYGRPLLFWKNGRYLVYIGQNMVGGAYPLFKYDLEQHISEKIADTLPIFNYSYWASEVWVSNDGETISYFIHDDTGISYHSNNGQDHTFNLYNLMPISISDNRRWVLLRDQERMFYLGDLVEERIRLIAPPIPAWATEYPISDWLWTLDQQYLILQTYLEGYRGYSIYNLKTHSLQHFKSSNRVLGLVHRNPQNPSSFTFALSDESVSESSRYTVLLPIGEVVKHDAQHPEISWLFPPRNFNPNRLFAIGIGLLLISQSATLFRKIKRVLPY